MIILFLLTFSLNQEVYNKREGSLTWGTCCWLKDSGFRVLRVSCLWLVLWITDKSEVSSCFLPNSHGRWIIGLWLLMLLDKYMHQKSFPWKWRSVVESPKEAWCQSRRPGRFLLTNRRNVAFHFMPFVTELLRLPFACYSFQLFAGDYFSIIIILQRMYAIYKQTHPPTGIEHCEYCQFFFTSWKTIVLWQEHHSFVSTSFIPKTR